MLTVLMLDIDDFKKINDHFGHDAGDQVLKAFCQCILSNKRTADLFGRLGGEEFAMLLPESNLLSAAEFAERIRAAIEALILKVHHVTVDLTVSIGVAEIAGGDSSILQLLNLADNKLYDAKRFGKNRVCL